MFKHKQIVAAISLNPVIMQTRFLQL